MNVANSKNCKQLYELSGWEGTYFTHYDDKVTGEQVMQSMVEKDWCPAYDLGFMLRKLPLNIDGFFVQLNHFGTDNGYWTIQYHKHRIEENSHVYSMSQTTDTPEDAACQLLCELIKQGIIQPREGLK